MTRWMTNRLMTRGLTQGDSTWVSHDDGALFFSAPLLFTILMTSRDAIDGISPQEICAEDCRHCSQNSDADHRVFGSF